MRFNLYRVIYVFGVELTDMQTEDYIFSGSRAPGKEQSSLHQKSQINLHAVSPMVASGCKGEQLLSVAPLC